VVLPAKAAMRAPPLPAEDDAELIERIQRGDSRAMGSVYDRHGPSLFALALRMLGREREAEDLLHDVFLEAWQHARDYDRTKGSLHTWLAVRLRSRALDRLGRAEARHTRSLEESAESVRVLPDGALNAVDGLAVRRALERLETNVRRVLELSYFDGLTAREIAEREAVPLGTVKSRLARGLSALEALFDVKGNGS
jgi:RNA polymerase sigma-70 factor, ECF subfamily